MKRLGAAALVAGVLALGAGAPASAHHSFSAFYDMNDAISITGKVVQVRLANPHSWFFLDVEDESGEAVRWSFEAGTPSGMIRNGYSKDVIKEGDVVTINGFRARDESKHSGMLRELVMADGTKFGMFGPQQGSSAR
jgi:DNA/RNA endonuclease YhcR with UshA esterase domain